MGMCTALLSLSLSLFVCFFHIYYFSSSARSTVFLYVFVLLSFWLRSGISPFPNGHFTFNLSPEKNNSQLQFGWKSSKTKETGFSNIWQCREKVLQVNQMSLTNNDSFFLKLLSIFFCYQEAEWVGVIGNGNEVLAISIVSKRIRLKKRAVMWLNS